MSVGGFIDFIYIKYGGSFRFPPPWISCPALSNRRAIAHAAGPAALRYLAYRHRSGEVLFSPILGVACGALRAKNFCARSNAPPLSYDLACRFFLRRFGIVNNLSGGVCHQDQVFTSSLDVRPLEAGRFLVALRLDLDR
jgi:hypothetical protein